MFSSCLTTQRSKTCAGFVIFEDYASRGNILFAKVGRSRLAGTFFLVSFNEEENPALAITEYGNHYCFGMTRR